MVIRLFYQNKGTDLGQENAVEYIFSKVVFYLCVSVRACVCQPEIDVDYAFKKSYAILSNPGTNLFRNGYWRANKTLQDIIFCQASNEMYSSLNHIFVQFFVFRF